ncbi:MAG: hypothetical protein DDT19_02419 [Syntrophomonadaceae bacterium]|nr:hypothetical protein [Bacillota bacterium]
MAKRHTKRGQKLPNLRTMRKELEAYFDTPEGREALARAPRCMLVTVDGNNEVMMHETTKALAIQLLLAEYGGESKWQEGQSKREDI